jgi:anthranilate phosphoribosyltransferase
VVHGADGLDELSTTGPSFVAELKDGEVRTFDVVPEDAGLPTVRPEALKGGDAKANAEAMRAMLDGERGPFRDVVLFNAAAALIVAGKAGDLKEGVKRAAAALDCGAAKATLDRLIEITHLPAPKAGAP